MKNEQTLAEAIGNGVYEHLKHSDLGYLNFQVLQIEGIVQKVAKEVIDQHQAQPDTTMEDRAREFLRSKDWWEDSIEKHYGYLVQFAQQELAVIEKKYLKEQIELNAVIGELKGHIRVLKMKG